MKFYSAYPMIPSTSIMSYLASKMNKAEIIVEQAEDEIAAINMAITYQWYKERVYKLGTDYDASNKLTAIQKAMEWDGKIPIGILYREEMLDFQSKIGLERRLLTGRRI